MSEPSNAELIAEARKFAHSVSHNPIGYSAKLAARLADRLEALSRPDPGAAETGGWVLVPREPPIELLVSMAVRDDHGLGVPGHYDQPMYRTLALGLDGPTHAQRMESAISTMRQLYEEVVGEGFYGPEVAERYRALLPPPPGPQGEGR